MRRTIAAAVAVGAGAAWGHTGVERYVRSPLPAGSYRVAWRVRFEDGHRRQDIWTFRVR